MGLHALRLKIIDPKTGKELVFETPAPADFFALMNQTKLKATSKKPVKPASRK